MIGGNEIFCGHVDEHVCEFVGLCLCVSVYDLIHVFMGLRNRYHGFEMFLSPLFYDIIVVKILCT